MSEAYSTAATGHDGDQDEDDYGWITTAEDEGQSSHYQRHILAGVGRSRSRSRSSSTLDGGHDSIIASSHRFGGDDNDEGLIFGDLEL